MKKALIKIGVVLPFSGSEDIAGPMCLQGAKMAVAEINGAGGLLRGNKLELVVEDSQTEAIIALEKAKKLVLEDKVTAILGPVISTARNLVMDVMREYKIPLLYGTDYEGEACDRYLFCYSAIPEHYLKPFIPYLFENYGKSIYLLGSDYVWPIKTNEYTKRIVSRLGGTVVGEEYFHFGITDFSTTIKKIIDSGAKTVLTLLIDKDTQTFLRQFNKHGLQNKIKLAVMAFNENMLSSMPNEQVEGILTCNHFFSCLDRPETKDFVDRQRKMFGSDTMVSYYTESHYGLIMAFKNAIEKTQSLDIEKIIDAMGDQSLLSGNGEVTMRRNDHHMVLNIVIVEVNGGQFVQRKYIGSISPENQCAGKKMR